MCTLLNATPASCDYFLAGITDLWMTNSTWLSASTASAITMSGTAKFFKMQFEPNTGFYTSEVVPGIAKHVDQSIGFQNINEGQSMNDIAKSLDLGRFVAIVKSRSTGKKFIIGRTGSGLQIVTNTQNSGTGESDQNLGLIATLKCASTERPLEYTGTDASIPTY